MPAFPQVKARLDSIQQRLQSDQSFRRVYPKQVAKEIHQEQLLEAQLAKQVFTPRMHSR
jgi:hypothetical protein